MSLTNILSKSFQTIVPKCHRMFLEYAFLAAFGITSILPTRAFSQSYSGKILIRDGDSFRPASSSTELVLKAKIPTSADEKKIPMSVNSGGIFYKTFELEELVTAGARQADLFVPADVCVTSTEVDPQGAQTTYEFSLTYPRSDFDKKVDITQFICLYKDQLWNPKLGCQGFTLTRRDKKTTSKDVVLLVPGFHNKNKEFGNMHELLQSKGYTVLEFNYPNDQDINKSSNLLMDAIYDVIPASVGPERTNILAHSMGCLVARNFIENTTSPVKSFIMLAPPNFGSKQAWNICQGGPLKRAIYCNLEQFLRKYDVNAPAYSQLAIGSRHIIREAWQLYVPAAPKRDDLVRFNEKYKKLPTLIIAGNDADLFPGAGWILPETKQGQGDGFVSICSANLPGIPMIIADGMTHATIKGTDEFNNPLDQSQYLGVLESIIHFLENHAILPSETRAKLNILLPDNTLDGALLLVSDTQNNFVLSIDDKITTDDFFTFDDPEEELSKANQTVNYDPTSQMCTYFIYNQANIKDALRKKGKKPIFGLPSGVYNLCTFERSRQLLGFLLFVDDFSYRLVKNIGQVNIRPGRFVIYVYAENNFTGLSQFNDFSASLSTDEKDPSLETRVTSAGLSQPTQSPVETAVQGSTSSSESVAKGNLKVAFLEKGDKNNLIVSLLSYHEGWFSSGFDKKQLVTQNVAPVMPVFCDGKVVFIEKGIDDNIAIYDLKTEKISIVDEDGKECKLFSSPDSRFVAYYVRELQRHRPCKTGVGIVDLRTMHTKIISDNLAFEPFDFNIPISWSPQSNKLVFVGYSNLCVYDFDCGEIVFAIDNRWHPQSTKDGWRNIFPLFGPDGETIAFSKVIAPKQETYSKISVMSYDAKRSLKVMPFKSLQFKNVPIISSEVFIDEDGDYDWRTKSLYITHELSEKGLLFECIKATNTKLTETLYLISGISDVPIELFTAQFPKEAIWQGLYMNSQIISANFISDCEILFRIRLPYNEINDEKLADLHDIFLYDVQKKKFQRLTNNAASDLEACLTASQQQVVIKPNIFAFNVVKNKTPEQLAADVKHDEIMAVKGECDDYNHRYKNLDTAKVILEELVGAFPDNVDYVLDLSDVYFSLMNFQYEILCQYKTQSKLNTPGFDKPPALGEFMYYLDRAEELNTRAQVLFSGMPDDKSKQKIQRALQTIESCRQEFASTLTK